MPAEHLEFFAGIKGVPKSDVKKAVTDTIATVGLTEKTAVLAASLSGGQKRKLSVAIALIGGSKVVILDEPTSGLFTCYSLEMYRLICPRLLFTAPSNIII